MTTFSISWTQDSDTWFVIACGVRSAIGRQSYAVGLTCDWLRRHWDEIPPRWQEMIKRDVVEAVAQADAGNKSLGMDMDAVLWRELAGWLK